MSRLFLEDFFLTVPLKVCDKTSKLVRMEWKKLSRLEEENPIIISYLPTPYPLHPASTAAFMAILSKDEKYSHLFGETRHLLISLVELEVEADV